MVAVFLYDSQVNLTRTFEMLQKSKTIIDDTLEQNPMEV